MKKKLIALSLALLMVFSLLPVMAFADDAELDLGGAVDGVLTLDANVKVSSMLSITEDLTLVLNGHTVTGCGKTFEIINAAKLTVDGSVANSKMENVRFTVGKSPNNNGSLELNGGEYSIKNNTVIHVNGDCKECNVTINNAKVTSVGDNGIQLNGGGTFVINNSEITGATAIYMKAGSLTVKGSNTKITANGEYAAAIVGHDGSNATGDAIVLDSTTGYKGDIKLDIQAGTVTSANGSAIHEALVGAGTTMTASIMISGGTFKGAEDKNVIETSEQFKLAKVEGTVKAEITGGEFTDASADDYLAKGYALLPFEDSTKDAPHFGIVNYQKALGAIATEATIVPPQDYVATKTNEADKVAEILNAAIAWYVSKSYTNAQALAAIFPASEMYGSNQIWEADDTLDDEDIDLFVNNLGNAVINAVKDILAATESKPENTVENFVDVAAASQLKVHFAKCEDAAAEACAEIDAELKALGEAGGFNILANLKAANAKRTIKMIPELVTIYAIKTDTINELQKLALGENTALASLALGASLIAGIFAIKFDKGAEFDLAGQLLSMMSGLFGFLTNLFS